MSASEFLDRVEQQGFLETSVVADLRRQLETSSRAISAEALAKLLVENGHLTRFQATRIIDEVTARQEQRKSARAEAKDNFREKVATPSPKKVSREEDELVALDSPLEPARSKSSKGNAKSEDDDVVMLESVEPSPKSSQLRPLPFESQRGRGQSPAGLTPLQPVAEGLTALDDGGLTTLDPIDTGPVGRDAFSATDLGQRPATEFAKKRERKNPFDSPLMLVGGGVLVVLTIAVVVLFFSLRQGNAADYLDQAEKEYAEGNYPTALEIYKKYLENGGSKTSLAKVRMAMCEFRMEAEGARDPMAGLKAANTILPKIKKEDEFNKAREELAYLLPQLALSFAKRAQTTSRADDDDKTIDKTEEVLKSLDETMKMVDDPNLIPTTLRKGQMAVIDEVNDIKGSVQRQILQHRKLRKTLTDMDKAIKEGNIPNAFTARQALLAEYPGLANHEEVLAKVHQLGERERELVVVKQDEMTAAADDATEKAPQVVIYGRSGGGIPGVSDENLVVFVNGAVYGLDAASGKMNWRRFVGYDSSQPQTIGTGADAGALLADTDRNELLRVKITTGEIVWRLPIGEPFLPPVIWRNDRVLVTTQAGRILNIDQATGLSRRQTTLQQPVATRVGANDKFPVCYQVAENDHVYAISIGSMECSSVLYLGQRPGSIVVPPVIAVGFLFITENVGTNRSQVHVYKLDENGVALPGAVQAPIQLDGQMLHAPIVATRRLIFATNLGAVVVLDVNPQQETPVTPEISPVPASRTTPVVSHGLVSEGLLWVGDSRLSAYEIQASNAQVVRRWATFEGSSFVGPLQQVANAVIQVRRDPNSSGFRIAAVDGETGQTVFWQDDVAFPILDLAAQSNGDLLALSSVGAAVNISPDQVAAGVAEAPTDTRLAGDSFEQALRLPDNRYAFFSDSGQLLVYDPAQAGKEMRLVRLKMPPGGIGGEAITLNGGILIPLLNGQIVLLNPQSGNDQVLPFQPRGEPGAQVRWRRPTPVGAEQKDFVVADDQQRLYRVGIVDTGGAHLDALENPITLQEPIFGPLATLGDTVFGVLRRSDSDVLVFYSLPRLREEGAVPLKSPVTWGPERVGDVVLVATESDGLVALDQSRQQLWTSPLPYGPLAGTPAVVDGDFVCASQSGMVWRIRGTDGQEVGKQDLGEPLGGRPVVAGDVIWIPGAGGTMLKAPLISQ